LQYSTGWRFKKRPGIDYFLSQVGPPTFEVVVYSQEQGMVRKLCIVTFIYNAVVNIIVIIIIIIVIVVFFVVV
jgi:hypothetical protein